MFERFTERARQVVVITQEEARQHEHGEINTGHLLVALMREEEGLACRVLEQSGFTVESLRGGLLSVYPAGTQASGEAERVGSGDTTGEPNQLPFTEPTRRALEKALREALALGHNYIGTEHLLLGLVCVVEEDDGLTVIAGQMLALTPDLDLRNDVIRKLMGPSGRRPVSLTPSRANEIFAALIDLGGFTSASMTGEGTLVAQLAEPLNPKQLKALADALDGYDASVSGVMVTVR